MKILYTESSPNIGGQELQAITQMSAFERAGHRVILACRKNSRIAEEAAKQSLRTIYIPFRNSLHLPSVWALRKFIRLFCPDIVVCHSGHDSNIVGIVRLSLPKNAQFRILRQKTYLTRNTRMFSLNHLCDSVIVPGQKMREELLKAGCTRPVNVVSPGFDFGKLRREMSSPLPEHIQSWLNCREKVPIIVQTGMLRPEKGHDFMLEILFNLKQKGMQFLWLIVGAGKHEAMMNLQKKIAARGMKDSVLMCGKLSPVAPVYRVASLMVMPSSNESFGMSAVEAVACGIPVIASYVGGLPTVIQNGRHGILLPPDDQTVWEEALYSFLTNPAYIQGITIQTREDMETRFDINRTIGRILALGEQCR